MTSDANHAFVAAAVGVTVLILLYPRLPMASIVGSDIAHAVPLTPVAGAGRWALGAVDWHLMGVLLVGFLPGIMLGSYGAVPMPQPVLRVALSSSCWWCPARSRTEELQLPITVAATAA